MGIFEVFEETKKSIDLLGDNIIALNNGLVFIKKANLHYNAAEKSMKEALKICEPYATNKI
jgi:hypothetical protein